MASMVKFDQFLEDLGSKIHDLTSDQLTVALTNSAPTAATDAVLLDITEVAYTFCSARNVTTTSFLETAGVSKLICVDLVLTASGGAVGPFRYVVLYNNAPAAPLDPLICYYDYGSSITLNDTETLTIDFDAAGGVFTLT